MNRRVQAVIINLLRFDREGASQQSLTDAEWKDALEYCDRYQLTLPLERVLDDAPEWVLARLKDNAANNRTRQSQLFDLYQSLTTFEHIVLKGFAHWPYLCPDPELRTQYDIDLFCEKETLQSAQEAAVTLGYEPMTGREAFPTDHLPPMIRKTGWQWRGDFFDLEIPIAIELHYRFWDHVTERFGPGDLDEFWHRRETRHWKDVTFTTLNEADSLAYACLHALRHLLRGDARAGQFYEIAWFLHRQQEPGFWANWQQQHSPSLRRLQAICFRFARDWFGCQLAPAAQSEIDTLPENVQAWFEHFGRSPLEAPFRPNKDELWLHLCLLESRADKAVVLRRRLLPLKPPGAVYAIHTPDAQLTLALKIRKRWRYVVYVAKRAFHHTQALFPVAIGGAKWWMVRTELGPQFWQFYRAFLIFNLALMIFYLLYNLHLVGLGYDEGFIGQVTSVMHIGSLAGSLFVGLFAARIGMRPSLIFCFIGNGLIFALRTLAAGKAELLMAALAGGVGQSIWAVCLAPTVTMLTTERGRAMAFGLIFSTGVGLGVVAGALGGRLPAITHSTQNALLVAAVMAPLAVLPLLRLKLTTPFDSTRPAYAVNPFLLRYLGALALWGAATGAFNPFFNVFFSRSMHFDVAKIGAIYSATQAAQVVAMVLSPLVLKRFGVVPAISLMQAATGIALAGLGVSPPLLAGWIYGMYMAFQYMSEPGMYSLLMTTVPAEQRTGAAALNFITLFASQAVAAWAAGEAIASYGYRPLLLVAGLLALLAARAMMSVTRSR